MIALLFALVQEGPFSHEVSSASSKDGLAWTHDNVVHLKHASVPSAIATPEGWIRIYFVDAEKPPEHVNCVESKDGGRTFQKTGFAIEKMAQKKSVDPCIVRLEDGRYRLYYYGCRENPDAEGKHSIYSAISKDGIRFTEEKAVFEREGLVDPDVFWTGTQWIMHVFSLSEHGTVVAKSQDGLAFEYAGLLEPRNWGVTKPVTLKDGSFRMYGFDQGAGKQQTIASFTSKDGLKWTKEDGLRLRAPEGKEITDPFVIPLADGSWKMYYKTSAKRKRP